jgi:hypothetical protein
VRNTSKNYLHRKDAGPNADQSREQQNAVVEILGVEIQAGAIFIVKLGRIDVAELLTEAVDGRWE